jgi:hypothetical protein
MVLTKIYFSFSSLVRLSISSIFVAVIFQASQRYLYPSTFITSISPSSSLPQACQTDIIMDLPSVPAPMQGFLPYLARQSKVAEALQPYKTYESKLRETFAQYRDNAILNDPHINTVPIFAGHEQTVKVHARDLHHETLEEKEKFLLPLSASDRKPNGSSAIVGSLKEFRTNFNLFSESSLIDLDWTNIVAAGSSVVTSLLPVEAPHNESKRALRQEISPQVVEPR